MGHDESLARKIVGEHFARGDKLHWFEDLYVAAEGDAGKIPWGDPEPNPNLVAWAERDGVRGDDHAGPRRRALVVGCGLGDDAEYLAGRGFDVTAFDVAPTAVAWCRTRWPDSDVDYRVGDLLAMPTEWHDAFDLVFEAYTLQSLPREVLRQALSGLVPPLRAGGRLLIVCRGRQADEDPVRIPWPLAREDFDLLIEDGLEEVRFEDYTDETEKPPCRRFRVEFGRPT